MRRIGIRTTSLHQDALGALSTAGELGYDGIEVVVRDNEEIRRWQTRDGAAEILAAIEKTGCLVSSLSCASYRAVNFGLPD
ncbi:MAG TPA: hypothetical protein VKX96_12275, partial [Chloroflexota bacterium]|nr:hypothetical protein [Chloroflexota bacterium]